MYNIKLFTLSNVVSVIPAFLQIAFTCQGVYSLGEQILECPKWKVFMKLCHKFHIYCIIEYFLCPSGIRHGRNQNIRVCLLEGGMKMFVKGRFQLIMVALEQRSGCHQDGLEPASVHHECSN